MQTVSNYRTYAEECRRLASVMETESGREQLLGLAAAWEQLADERERALKGDGGAET